MERASVLQPIPLTLMRSRTHQMLKESAACILQKSSLVNSHLVTVG